MIGLTVHDVKSIKIDEWDYPKSKKWKVIHIRLETISGEFMDISAFCLKKMVIDVDDNSDASC